MKNERFLNIIEDIDDEYILSAAPKIKRARRVRWIRVAAIAACFSVIVAAVLALSLNSADDITPIAPVSEESEPSSELSSEPSDNVSETESVDVSGVDESSEPDEEISVPDISEPIYSEYAFVSPASEEEMATETSILGFNADLPLDVKSLDVTNVSMAEEELFKSHADTIFYGTIKEVNNVKADFNGWTFYLGVLTVKVEKTYRGKVTAGKEVTILNYAPIGVDAEIPGNEYVGNLIAGEKAIFLTHKYKSNEYAEVKGAKMTYSDVAAYGLSDGERFIFIDDQNGPIFARPFYDSISAAKTFDEVEQYVIEMIQSTK